MAVPEEDQLQFSEIPVSQPTKSRRGPILTVMVIVVLLVLLLLMFRSPRQDPSTARSTATVKRASIEKRIEIDGQIVPASSYSLAFPVPASDVVVGPNIASVNVAVGDEVSAGAILAQLEGDNVDSARLRAPVDGVITDIKGAAGAPPPPGPMIQMRTNTLEGEFRINETDLALLSPGMEATVTIPVLSRSLTVSIGQLPKDPVAQTAAATVGGIQSAGASAGQGTATYLLLIELPNIENLRPGLTARLLVIPQKATDSLVVPAAAVVGEGRNAQVEVIVDKRTELRNIAVGVSDGRSTEIIAGLSEGDEVVLNPGAEERN